MNIKRYIDMMVKKSVRRAFRDEDASKWQYKLTDNMHDVGAMLRMPVLGKLASTFSRRLFNVWDNRERYSATLGSLKQHLLKVLKNKDPKYMREFNYLIGQVSRAHENELRSEGKL